MDPPVNRKPGTQLSGMEAERYFIQQEMLLEFTRLFDYNEGSDRAIAIVGPSFLDSLLTDVLVNFLVDDGKEVLKLLRPDGPIGSFGARVSTCYCLGLIGEIVTADLRYVAKIRNRFAHDLHSSFADPQIMGWCNSLRWHKESLGDPPPNANARELFQVGVNQLVAHLCGLVGLALHYKRPKAN